MCVNVCIAQLANELYTQTVRRGFETRPDH